ncbi:MAG: DoxX family membrane protein [Methanobacteriota archaeon]
MVRPHEVSGLFSHYDRYGHVALRAGLSMAFLFFGLDRAARGYLLVDDLGIPPSAVWAQMLAAIEVFIGVALLIGLVTRPVALFAAAILLRALPTGAPEGGWPAIVLVAGAVSLFVTGSPVAGFDARNPTFPFGAPRPLLRWLERLEDRGVAHLLPRLALGVALLYAGYRKFGPDRIPTLEFTLDHAVLLGPVATVTLLATIQIVAGTLLVVGVGTRLGAGLAALYSAAAIVLFGEPDLGPAVHHLGWAGAGVAVLLWGPAPWGLPAVLSRAAHRRTRRAHGTTLVAVVVAVLVAATVTAGATIRGTGGYLSEDLAKEFVLFRVTWVAETGTPFTADDVATEGETQALEVALCACVVQAAFALTWEDDREDSRPDRFHLAIGPPPGVRAPPAQEGQSGTLRALVAARPAPVETHVRARSETEAEAKVSSASTAPPEAWLVTVRLVDAGDRMDPLGRISIEADDENPFSLDVDVTTYSPHASRIP